MKMHDCEIINISDMGVYAQIALTDRASENSMEK